MTRRSDIDRLYDLLERLEERVGGKRLLGDCNGRMDWPERGIYLFFSPDETRADDERLRITRVGTHAISRGSATSLWNRLRTHRGSFRGSYAGGGNHRGSVFRLRVGEAMIERDDLHDAFPKWGKGSSAAREQRLQELPHERRVSDYIRELPFLWVTVDDEPGPDSRRAYLERNLIGMLSNYDREPIDPRDPDWLGGYSTSEYISGSGLWNVDHVTDGSDPDCLDVLETYVEGTGPL